MIRAYYWNKRANFGDLLNETLLNCLQVGYSYASPDEAELVMIGSVLEHLPQGFTGTVCGAGALRPDSDIDLSHARVLALRGVLSATLARGVPSSVVLGDPGLLMPLWAPAPPARHDLGVVPHWSDKELAKRFSYGKIINPADPPSEVIRQIASCKRIISSSLHGLVIADAYGIPRRAELFAQAAREGGDFKFRDYQSVYSDPDPHFGQMWAAPYGEVTEIRARLRAALAHAVGQPPPPDPIPAPEPGRRQRGRRPLISLLVPYRHLPGHSEHRERVWHWLHRYWRHHLPHAEIVIGHDSGHPYSKSCAVNDAACRARGKVFVVLDADAYLDGEIIERCARNIEEAVRAGRRLWYVPYRRLYRLSEDITLDLLDTDPRLSYAVPSPPPVSWLETDVGCNYGYLYGAMIQIMPAQAFFEVGGMDGRMRGWGGEDVALMRALDTLYAPHEVSDDDICHLWHARPGKDWKTRRWVGQVDGVANSRLSHRYGQASGETGAMRALVDERPKLVPLSPWYLRSHQK